MRRQSATPITAIFLLLGPLVASAFTSSTAATRRSSSGTSATRAFQISSGMLTATAPSSRRRFPPDKIGDHRDSYSALSLRAASENADGHGDPNGIIARRIVVTGDVQGGYYRACVLNEAGRFRRLIGTMTPPDDSDTAEIYVEGKRKMVEGFIRWCKKGDVGLSQRASVKEVFEEDPTGLYDGFYVKTH